MTFEEWQSAMPERLAQGPLWSFEAYRMALYLYDLAWDDCALLLKDPRGREVAGQLIRSAGAISAAIEEGFGRGFGREYAYKLRIAIGESRETQGSYFRGRRLLPPELLAERLQLLDNIISRLVLVERKQRAYRDE